MVSCTVNLPSWNYVTQLCFASWISSVNLWLVWKTEKRQPFLLHESQREVQALCSSGSASSPSGLGSTQVLKGFSFYSGFFADLGQMHMNVHFHGKWYWLSLPKYLDLIIMVWNWYKSEMKSDLSYQFSSLSGLFFF